MIPMLGGGAYRRPGTFFEFDTAGYNAAYIPTLWPFVRSQTEVYCIQPTILFTPVAGATNYINFFRPTSNTTVTTQGTLGTGTDLHSYGIATQSGGLGTYDEWHDVQWTQSADVLYLVHENRKPKRLSLTATDAFTMTDFDNGLTGTTFRDAWPYRSINATATTLSVSNGAVGTGRTLTASTAIFYSTHVGAVFKINNGAAYGCVRVTSIGAGPYPVTTCTVEVMVEVDAAAAPTAAVTTWWESAWSDYRGWPRSICFFQDRLVYGGNESQPDDIWFSETGDYNQLSVSDESDPYGGPTTSEPFTIKLLSTQLNKVQWLSAEKSLAVGTFADEWLIDTETTGPFGADNSKTTVQSHYGSSYLPAARVGNELIFCSADGSELRSFIFNFQEDSYVSDRIMTLYDHRPGADNSLLSYGNKKIRRFQWDESRSTLWVLDTAGNFFGLTRDRRLGVNAFHSHQFGGYDSSLVSSSLGSGSTETSDPNYTNCAGSVCSFVVIPNPISRVNDVWLLVKRYINSTYTVHLERMIGKDYPFSTSYKESDVRIGHYFTDASVCTQNDYGGAENYSFSGFSHLTGETPVGAAFSTKGIVKVTGSAVSGGTTTIQSPYPSQYLDELMTINWGLAYDCIVEPVRIEAGSQIGTAQGAIKRIHEVHIRFYKTLAAKVGRDSSNLETILFRTGSLAMGLSPELFSGDKKVKLDGDYDRDGLVYILCDQPLPFGVLSVVAEGMTYDG